VGACGPCLRTKQTEPESANQVVLGARFESANVSWSFRAVVPRYTFLTKRARPEKSKK
jgi:hypothetical protein